MNAEKKDYSTTSKTTENFCTEKGFLFHIKFVKTMERNGKIYVSATGGRPIEWQKLEAACDGRKYIYKGIPIENL
jgi:hypothetical protein